MSFAYSNASAGRFISTGAVRFIPLEFVPDYMHIVNLTNLNSVANPGVVKKAFWQPGMVSGQAELLKNTAGAATVETSLISSNGFVPYNSAQPGLEAPKTINSVSQAASAVVNITAHGFQVGDVLKFYNVTNMQQISTMDFEVLTVPTANTFTIPLNSSAFSAPGAGGTVRRYTNGAYFVPKTRLITSITQAANGVVTTSTAHGYVTSEYVFFNLFNSPASGSFGMSELNLRTAKITVLSPTTFSIDVDTSGFTPFAFPSSASVPLTHPVVVPSGSIGVYPTIEVPFNPIYLVESKPAYQNKAQIGMVLGSSICGAANDEIVYFAKKADWYMNLN